MARFPMLRVAHELIPPTFHDAVRDLLNRYKGLLEGQLGRMDGTPHRITLKQGAEPMMSPVQN